MTEDVRNQVVNCLMRNKDIFPWTPHDLEGIDPGVITHHLNKYQARFKAEKATLRT
ncbi:UNVERIFIED_CONTAM: hypothetical protein Sradi_6653400 [Sesamum radiatum]|uniref:Uncharacterized protein n=1 Tax=Sesamum radiatum TaxID=300843 RepID=A0AAW2JPR4_SESRA